MAAEGAQTAIGRRGFLAGSVAAAAVAASGSLAARPARAATRPNVLVVVTDDHPKGTAWSMSKARNWLVGSGVEFTNGHVTTPLCAPSRSTIFSGRYAHNHGVRDNGHAHNLDQSTTFQRHLQNAGYRNGFFGKYLNGWNVADAPPHFEDYALLSPVGYNDGQFNHNGTIATVPGYTTHRIRDFALDFIDKGATDARPWFAYVAPYASHGPRTAEPKYADTAVPAWSGRPSVGEADKSDKPAYIQNAAATLADGRAIRREQLRSLLSVDDALQAFHDKLEATGQLADTLVVFIGDNGFLWADHGWTKKSVPYRPAIEVPFWLSWPAGGFGSGTTDGRLVANVDISATVLDAAGITPPTPQDGHSLLGTHSRDHLLTEWWKHGTGAGGPNTWASYVSKTGQYTEYYSLHTDAGGVPVGTGNVVFREYYDLANDPYQLVNKLHGATAAQEQAWGIPTLAARLAADRTA